MAGQVGVIGHLTIGKGSIVASKSAVYKSLEPDSFVSGIPARPHKKRLRQDVIINQLPGILNRLRKLEKEFSIKNTNLSREEQINAFNKNMTEGGWISKDFPDLANKFNSRCWYC